MEYGFILYLCAQNGIWIHTSLYIHIIEIENLIDYLEEMEIKDQLNLSKKPR